LQYKPRPPIAARAGLGLILDGLRDPGNLGTILRTAWGAGVGEVWATPETADFHAPKVLRAAQGAHFHLRLRVLERRALLDAADLEGWWLAAADARAPVPFWRAELKRPCMICVGNEAHGLGADLAAAAREKVSVPLAPGVDSLNAAVGIGVILFEIVRREGSA
jgi:TrmH family RNA methyltransferase